MGIIQQQTIKGTIYSYLGVFIGFISINVIQPHALTTEQVGLNGILLSFSMLFSQFATLGFSGTSRYFPYFRNEEKKHHGYLFLYCVVALIGTAIFITAVCVFKEEIISSKAQKSSLFSQYYWFLIPLIIFTVFFNVFEMYARVLYNAASGRILTEFTKRLFILITILLIYFNLVDFNTFMILWLIANIIPTLLLTARLIRDKQFHLEPNFKFLDKETRTKIIRICIFSLLTASSPVIVDNIDRYIINEKFGLSNTGIYTMALYFATIITLPARSLYSIATTVIAEAWKANDMGAIRSVYKKSSINQIITSTFLFIIIWANVDNIFHFLPPDYQSGKYVIFFIAIGYLIDSSTGINGVIMSTSKYFRYDAMFYVLLIGVTVVCNLILVPIYGITGAAIATAITLFIFNLFRCLFILYVFKMHPFTFKSPYTVLIGIVIYFLSVWIVPHIDNFIIDTIIRTAFITVVYWACIYYLKLSDDINRLLTGYVMKYRK
ncbi:MAG: polysaccharide biosynthesis protein [Sphingobacteriaceae bacterium]|nr:MAG: polysaccharide biosynthesis protein [Sphingobacteriaceae bacterium]